MKQGDKNNAGSEEPRKAGPPHWLAHRELNHRTHFERHASAREYRREKTLRQWLGMDRAVEEFAALRPPPRPLGEVLPEVLASIGMQQAHRLTQLREQWEEIVGADVARQARPCAIRREVLFVEVANATWLFVLKGQHRNRILERLEARFPGEFRDIRFVPRGRFVEDGPPE